MSWIASWEDSTNVTRATAKSENKDLAKQEAKKQLDAYIAQQRNAGEPVSQRDFKFKIKRAEK